MPFVLTKCGGSVICLLTLLFEMDLGYSGACPGDRIRVIPNGVARSTGSAIRMFGPKDTVLFKIWIR